MCLFRIAKLSNINGKGQVASLKQLFCAANEIEKD